MFWKNVSKKLMMIKTAGNTTAGAVICRDKIKVTAKRKTGTQTSHLRKAVDSFASIKTTSLITEL